MKPGARRINRGHGPLLQGLLPQGPLLQRGFSLLEAIVALVILTAALAGAWTWVANDVRSSSRVRDLALEEAAVQQAVAELEQVDLGAQPNGSLRWRDYRIDWQASALEPPRRGREPIGGESNYVIALYDVALVVAHHERVIGTPGLRMLQHRAHSRDGDGE